MHRPITRRECLRLAGTTVAGIIAVRYAYTQHPNGNLLYNKEGQPVGPFSTIGYGPELEVDAKGKPQKP